MATKIIKIIKKQRLKLKILFFKLQSALELPLEIRFKQGIQRNI
jgi:hypothetical protein